MNVLPFRRQPSRTEKHDPLSAEVEALRNEARDVIRICNRLLTLKLTTLRAPRASQDLDMLRGLLNDIGYLEDLIKQNERFLARTGSSPLD